MILIFLLLFALKFSWNSVGNMRSAIKYQDWMNFLKKLQSRMKVFQIRNKFEIATATQNVVP